MNHKLDQKRFYYTHYVDDGATDASTTPEVRHHSHFNLPLVLMSHKLD